jgi:subtilase family serine protease
VMRRLRILLPTLFAALLVATASAQLQTPLTHHLRSVVANGQAKVVGRLPANQTLQLVLVLPLRNQTELDNLLHDLYNPNSPSYHHFLTVDQFTARFGPTQQDYNTALAFAEDNGLKVVATSPNRLNIQVTGTVAAIERAFHVTMRTYQHPTENRTFFSPDREPTVDLPFQLWHISGLSNYSIPHPAGLTRRPAGSAAKSEATTGSGPSASFLGSDMRAAYAGGTSLTGSGQSLGLLEYYGTDLADLQTYYTNVHQTYPGSVITLLSTDGTSTSCVDSKAGGDCDDTEQTLDMTQALGMAPGLSSLVVYVGSTDSAIFNAMATHTPLNAQLSSSWTWSPADPSTDDPYFEEFAAQGQNLFQAAGDDSKWTTSGTASEIYPADDVYVTSVGGTDLTTSSAAGPWASETAWSDGGGGVSPNKFALPSWQTSAAAGCSSCSKSYRNGPDVSANANFTFYVCADQTTCTANEYGGTSFAAPMWAGFLALVNQQSVANDKGTLGFINPALYTIGGGSSYDSDFHDVTSGSNGYSATTGYDLATGWGSPNGVSLINALAGSASTQPGFTLSASPSSVSVAQGNSGSTTITSTVTGGFDSAVSLSASGAPSGVTVGFSPASITGAGTSTLTFTVASSTAAGTYSITVTGTSGSTTETTTVSLTVTAPQTGSFSLSVSPSSGYLDQGQSGYAVVTSTVSGGFDSAVSFSASGVPSGVTASFSPSSLAAPGSGSTDFNLTVAKTAKTGTYTITITGTGGNQTHTTTLTLQIRR